MCWRHAFFDYMPLRGDATAKVYRNIPRGPLCELFFLDLRTYRGPNSANRQPARSRAADFMGERQLGWLKDALQYFSTVRIDGKTKIATITHRNRDGEKLWNVTLEPSGA